MSSSEFIDSAIPTPTVLLGHELKPLTIGKCLLLERFECHPIDDSEKLVFAVLICSHDYDELLHVLEDRWLTWKMRLWRWRLGKVDWEEKFDIWNDYFKDQTSCPLVVSTMDGSGKGDSGTPFLQHLKVYLMSKVGYTHAEVMNEVTVSQGLWDMYTHAEIEGTMRICDRQEIEDQQDWLETNKDEILKQAQEIWKKEGREPLGT